MEVSYNDMFPRLREWSAIFFCPSVDENLFGLPTSLAVHGVCGYMSQLVLVARESNFSIAHRRAASPMLRTLASDGTIRHTSRRQGSSARENNVTKCRAKCGRETLEQKDL